MGDGQIHVAVPVDVDVHDVERAYRRDGLRGEASQTSVDLQRERLTVAALQDVEVAIVIHVGPLRGVVAHAVLVTESKRAADDGVGRGGHQPAARVEQQSVAGDECAVHPAVAVEVAHVAIVIVLVAVAGGGERAGETERGGQEIGAAVDEAGPRCGRSR